MLLGMFRKNWLYFDKDSGAGGGGDDNSTKTEDSAGGAADESKDKSKDSTKAGDEKDKAKGEKTFTQAELDLIVKDRLEREKKKAESEAEKAKKKAEDEALEKNQEFKTLAEQRQVRIVELEGSVKELEAVKEAAERYKAALDKQLKAIKDTLPKHILPLISKMDPIEAMDYITNNAKDLGVTLQSYQATPDGTEKHLSDVQTKEGQQAASSLIRKNF